jgi:hypothetical protein
MMTAMCAARNILGANYDLWAINTEAEYHEEGTEKSSSRAAVDIRRPAYAEPILVSRPSYSAQAVNSPVPVQAQAAKAAAGSALPPL